MNKLTKTLLGGAALSVLAAVPAIAQLEHPAMHVTAMYAGHAVNKTKLHVRGGVHGDYVSYTISVYSYQPASAPKKTHLIQTYYKWNSNFTTCSNPKQKIRAPKKSVYAKIGTATETYSLGCSSGPTVYRGDTWSNKTGVGGNIDTFNSYLIGRFNNSGNKYKGTMHLYVQVFIQ